MNRIVFSFVIMFAICQVSAQTLDSIAYHHFADYGPDTGGNLENILQLRDGNILFNLFHTYGLDNYAGNTYYKVSRHGAVLLDTLFVEDSDPPFFLFAKNPNNDNHIRVGVVHDTVTGGSSLQIFPFDSDMRFDSLNEVYVPLTDTTATWCWKGYLINPQNDLVFNYLTPSDNGDYDLHFACFGLDGTLKYETEMPYNFLINEGCLGLGVFNESPEEYYRYGRHHSNNSPSDFVCIIYDSLFQYKDSFTITASSLSPGIPQLKYNFGWEECLFLDGDDFILGSRYVQGSKDGVCLVRYDKQTLEQKNEVFFPSRPMLYDPAFRCSACPIGLGKDSEGSLYFAYNTQTPYFTDKVQIALTKMDADFNVQWQRYCLDIGYNYGQVMTVLDDGGAVVCGKHYGAPEIFFLIFSDDGWAINETEVQVRPYSYYPNPVQNELHLQYSPDVKPTQIELYDLQGRLVRTQRNGLESINMEGLSSGTYTMRVTLENGKVFSDKVVKK